LTGGRFIPGDFEGGKELVVKNVLCTLAVIAAAAAFSLSAFAQKREIARVQSTGRVMQEILNIPDDIPQDLIDRAKCVIVLPSVVKFAVGIGGNFGRGVMTCRSGSRNPSHWGAPAMIALEGGSFGLQLGGQATDFVLLVMSPRSAESILSSKVKLGADAAAAAGPKGRDLAAATDVTLRAEILSYSRSRGLFAGVSLEGSTLRADNTADKNLYGKKLDAKSIALHGAVAPPPAAKLLLAVLNRKAAVNKSAK
jgi:lipid-binding SYLF domain-containing protein